jgi:CBS domain containing-hemolysin-like protein
MIAVSHWSTSDYYLAITVAVLLLASGFFALAETSLVRMTRTRAQSLKDEGHRGASSLVRLVESPDRFLNPLLLLILICQLVSATLVGVLAGHLLGTAGLIVATVFEVVVIFVVFEAIPKNYAVHYVDRSAMVAAPVVEALLRFWPIKWVSSILLSIAKAVLRPLGVSDSFQKVTESEILAMADVAVGDQAIEETERDFIHSVIEFGDTIVREVMVPRIDMVDVSHDETVEVAFQRAVESGRSRLPVLGESVDDVIGVVNLRYLAKLIADGRGSEVVGQHILAAHFVPETKKVASLIGEFRKRKSHLFIVVDEYGGTAGLITLEDVLEELVGEIADESDLHEPDGEDQRGEHDGEIVVSGRLNIDDADEQYGLNLPKGGWDTVGGLILDLAGGVPEVNEIFDTAQYRFTVKRVDGRRIEEVLVESRNEDS